MNSEAPLVARPGLILGLRWCNTRIYAIGPVGASTRNYANYTMKGRSEVNSLLYRVYLPSMDLVDFLLGLRNVAPSADDLHFLLTSSHTSQAVEIHLLGRQCD